MNRTRDAMLLVLLAAILAGMGRLASLPRDPDVSRIACYVALANDITPLIDAAASDAAANGPECNPTPEVADGNQDARVDRFPTGERQKR